MLTLLLNMLLSILQPAVGFAGAQNEDTDFDFPYKQDVREYFSAYKNHSSVKFFDMMSAEGFSFDTPPTAMLYLSNPPKLSIEMPFLDRPIMPSPGTGSFCHPQTKTRKTENGP